MNCHKKNTKQDPFLNVRMKRCIQEKKKNLVEAHQAPLSISQQEHWSGLSFPPPGDLPDPGIESEPLALAGRFFTIESPGKSSYRSKEAKIRRLLELCLSLEAP